MTAGRTVGRVSPVIAFGVGDTVRVIAFVDESARSGTPGCAYVVAAAISLDDPHQVREVLRKHCKPRQRAIHWHDENHDRRLELAALISALRVGALATYCHPVGPSRYERARRVCLVALAYRLSREGVSEMVIESRREQQDGGDRSALIGAQRSGLDRSLHYGHLRKSEEPMLWAADIIAGAVGLHVTGESSGYYAAMTPTLLHVERVDP